MQRVAAILSGLFLFLADLFKRFFIDLARALYYAALEFDNGLQQTKTSTQRALIWLGIAVGVLGVLAILLQVTYSFVSTLGIGSYNETLGR